MGAARARIQRMRLAFVQPPRAAAASALPGIGELARHFADAGHDVTVLHAAGTAARPTGARSLPLPTLELGEAARAWSFAVAAERHLARERFDLVVGAAGTWVQDVLLLGGGCAAGSRVDGGAAAGAGRADPGFLAGRVERAIERRALRPGTCAAVIAGSMRVREEVLARYGLEPARVRVVYGGVDLRRFHPGLRQGPGARLRGQLGLREEDLCLLFPGHDLERDGLEELLEAFALVAPVRTAARLLIAGGNGGVERFERRARELGIADRTRFLGDGAGPEACYGAADLCVLPLRGAPFSPAALEALACGLPVVTTCMDGASELLTPGRDGSVLPRDRAPADLVQEVLLWCEPERIALGRAAARSLAELHGVSRPMAECAAVVEECA